MMERLIVPGVGVKRLGVQGSDIRICSVAKVNRVLLPLKRLTALFWGHATTRTRSHGQTIQS